MFDIHSIQFYGVALVVAMGLLALLFKQKKRQPASTHIVELTLDDDIEVPDGVDTLQFTSLDNGKLLVTRRGLPLAQGETVNLVATIIGDTIHIVEKRGAYALTGSRSTQRQGRQSLDFVAVRRWAVRYDSDVTGRWGKFTYTHRDGNSKQIDLQY